MISKLFKTLLLVIILVGCAGIKKSQYDIIASDLDKKIKQEQQNINEGGSYSDVYFSLNTYLLSTNDSIREKALNFLNGIDKLRKNVIKEKKDEIDHLSHEGRVIYIKQEIDAERRIGFFSQEQLYFLEKYLFEKMEEKNRTGGH